MERGISFARFSRISDDPTGHGKNASKSIEPTRSKNQVERLRSGERESILIVNSALDFPAMEGSLRRIEHVISSLADRVEDLAEAAEKKG
jgi:hypothetical protein